MEDIAENDDISSGSDEVAVTTHSETEDSWGTRAHTASPLEHTASECIEEVAKPVCFFPSPKLLRFAYKYQSALQRISKVIESWEKHSAIEADEVTASNTLPRSRLS